MVGFYKYVFNDSGQITQSLDLDSQRYTTAQIPQIRNYAPENGEG